MSLARLRPALSTALLPLLALVIGPSPSAASHANDLPIVLAAEDAKSGWASFRAISDGSPFTIDLEAGNIRGPFAWGMSVYDENQKWFLSGSYWGYPGRDGVAVEVNTDIYPVEFGTVQDGSPFSWTGTASFNDPSRGGHIQLPVTGEITIVAWWAANADWSWAFRARAGSTVDAVRTGSRAFIYTARDFESVALAQAYVAGSGGRAQLRGDLPLTISNTLVGAFGHGYSGVGSNHLSVTTPRGEESCDYPLVRGNTEVGIPGTGWCYWSTLDGPDAAGPGDYTFHASGAAFGLAASPGLERASEVALHGADAALPGPGEQLSFLQIDPTSSPELIRANPDGAWPISVISQIHGRAAWSPDGRRVAVAKEFSGGDVDLVSVDAGGTTPTRLTSNPNVDANPSWSPDGSRLAFDREGDILTVGADGTEELNLTAGTELNTGAPGWAPNGNRLVFHSLGEADGDLIYVMNADGGNITRLTPGRHPVWSPDGARIAFERDGDIYTIGPDGGNEVRLTAGERLDRFPAWSPDGSRIAFIQSLEDDTDVFVMAADGTDLIAITNAPTAETFPSWRPGRS